MAAVTSDTAIECDVAWEHSTTANMEKKIEIISLSISDQTWTASGDAKFTATIDDSSFNIVNDVAWYISKLRGVH